MDNYQAQEQFSDYTVVDSGARVVPKKFMANVFLWMFAALGISALFAYLFATTPSLLSLLLTETSRGYTMSGLGMLVMFAPLGFVLLMSFGYSRLSSSALTVLFILYAAITGISLSFILLTYTSSSVIGCFAAASAMFGVMAFMGYTTDKDLSSFGRIMTMGLIGIIVAMLINMFLRSPMMDYLISIVGVAVFTGLTAWDVQKLKMIGSGLAADGTAIEDTKKISILGALTLYLDFINLFLFLLRLFGRRK
jgi:FtsH-binding integral membrane protein